SIGGGSQIQRSAICIHHTRRKWDLRSLDLVPHLIADLGRCLGQDQRPLRDVHLLGVFGLRQRGRLLSRAGRRGHRESLRRRGTLRGGLQHLLPAVFGAVVLDVLKAPVLHDLRIVLAERGRPRDVPQTQRIHRCVFEVRHRQGIHVAQIVGILLHGSGEVLLGGLVVLALQRAESGGAIKDRAGLLFQLLEIGIGHSLRLGCGRERLQAAFGILASFLGVLLGILSGLRGRSPPIGEQRQSAQIIRFRLQQLLRCFFHLGLVANLLISRHQQLQRIHLHHAIGILLQEGLERGGLHFRLLLVQRGDVSVVFGGVLDLFLLLLPLLGGCPGLRRLLLGAFLGRGSSRQGKREDDERLLHVEWLLRFPGRVATSSHALGRAVAPLRPCRNSVTSGLL